MAAILRYFNEFDSIWSARVKVVEDIRKLSMTEM